MYQLESPKKMLKPAFISNINMKISRFSRGVWLVSEALGGERFSAALNDSVRSLKNGSFEQIFLMDLFAAHMRNFQSGKMSSTRLQVQLHTNSPSKTSRGPSHSVVISNITSTTWVTHGRESFFSPCNSWPRCKQPACPLISVLVGASFHSPRPFAHSNLISPANACFLLMAYWLCALWQWFMYTTKWDLWNNPWLGNRHPPTPLIRFSRKRPWWQWV